MIKLAVVDLDKTAKTVAKLVFIEFANAIRKLKLGEERWNPNVKETKYYEDYGLEYNPLFPNISKFKSTIIETLEIKLSNLNPEKLLGIDFVPELQDIKTHLNTFIKDIVNNFIKSTIKAVKIVLENTDHLAKMYNAYTVGFINGVIEFIARIAEFLGQLILLTFTYDGQQAFINTISEFWDKVSWDAVVKLISDTFGELFSYVKSTGGYKMAYDFGRFIPGLLELIIDIVAITKGAIRVVKKSKEIIGAFNNEIKRLEILATLNIDRKTLQALQEKDISIEIQPIYSSAQLSSGVPIKIPDGKKYHISYKDVIIETFDSDDKATNFLNQLLKNNPNEIKDLDFPRASIVGGVIRDGVGMIALGDFKIRRGDKILVCSLYSAINKVEKLFR